MVSDMVMAPLQSLSYPEQQVIRHMRELSAASKEWRLTVTMHQRATDSYVQIEPTPYLKVKAGDTFQLVD